LQSVYQFLAVGSVRVKVKFIPQQTWTGPRGSGSVKALDFLDLRHYKGGRSSAKRTGRLHPRRNPWYSFSEAESTPGHMVPSEPRKKSPVTPPGIDSGTVRLVAQCLNHYATPGPVVFVVGLIWMENSSYLSSFHAEFQGKV
jgi:hypothetical protein